MRDLLRERVAGFRARAPFFPALRFPNSSYCARNRSNSAIEIRICRVKRLGLIKPRLIRRRIDIGERLRYSAAGFSFNAPRCSGLRFSDMPRD